ILVNNSGIGSESTPDRVTDISMTDWDRVIDVNLRGVMLTSKFVLPGMIERGKGSIINISSIRGLLGNPNLASYCASKGGVVLLSREMALDYARYGVRVNCICPGFVNTEMFRVYLSKQDNPEEALRVFREMSPLNRVGEPEEIAKTVLFFANEASSFITGAVLPVDGGYTASGARSIL
ncbi:MAG: SDR family oxidoreductase, partial [Spirochaetaceae bacterium]|nr:SDR family oxidoreductase [Spirochaetaceae bacterium]